MSRRTHSTLDDPEVKSLVQSMLAADKTYDEIRAEVLTQTGKPVTRSAISRGKLRWESAAQQLEAARRDADALQQLVRDNPDGDLGGAAMGLMLSKILARFTNVQEGFDGADLLELGHLLVKTQRTSQMKDAIEIQRDRLEIIKQRAVAAAGKVKDALTGANVDPAEATKLVDEILGLTA